MIAEEKIIYRISDLKLLKPVNHEVIDDEYQMNVRFYKLQKGMLYSNHFNIKSIITLQTKEGEEKIKSYISKLDGKNIILKGNIRMPIKSIKEVKYEF